MISGTRARPPAANNTEASRTSASQRMRSPAPDPTYDSYRGTDSPISDARAADRLAKGSSGRSQCRGGGRPVSDTASDDVVGLMPGRNESGSRPARGCAPGDRQREGQARAFPDQAAASVGDGRLAASIEDERSCADSTLAVQNQRDALLLAAQGDASCPCATRSCRRLGAST
jgi:hypothetical protein